MHTKQERTTKTDLAVKYRDLLFLFCPTMPQNSGMQSDRWWGQTWLYNVMTSCTNSASPHLKTMKSRLAHGRSDLAVRHHDFMSIFGFTTLQNNGIQTDR